MNSKQEQTWKENCSFMKRKSEYIADYSKACIFILLILLFHLFSCNTEQQPSDLSEASDKKAIRAYQAYINNCASCHIPLKPATGPALSEELISSRSKEWLYIFLTNPAAIKNDTELYKRQQAYAPTRCILMDTTTTAQQEEIKLIIAYLKQYRSQHAPY